MPAITNRPIIIDHQWVTIDGPPLNVNIRLLGQHNSSMLCELWLLFALVHGVANLGAAKSGSVRVLGQSKSKGALVE